MLFTTLACFNGTGPTPPPSSCVYSARTTSRGSTRCFDVETAEIHVRSKSLGSFPTASSVVGTFQHHKQVAHGGYAAFGRGPPPGPFSKWRVSAALIVGGLHKSDVA